MKGEAKIIERLNEALFLELGPSINFGCITVFWRTGAISN
jgi:bacterioferritin (cytochrome b1)